MNLQDFENIRTVVVHKHCADGTMSALILQYALEFYLHFRDNVKIRYIDLLYDDEWKNIPAEPGMLWCDICPPPERVDEFIAAGTIVLDHHITRKETVEKFGDRGIFSTGPYISGATLAYNLWCEITHNHQTFSSLALEIEQLADLVATYDTWQRNSPDWNEAKALSEALRTFPLNSWLAGRWEFNRNCLDSTTSLGYGLLEKQAEDIKEAIKNSQQFILFGDEKPFTIRIFENPSLSNGVSEVVDDDLVVGFKTSLVNNSIRYTYSLRSQGKVNCAELAQKFGGGGHKNAAGFSLEFPPPHIICNQFLPLTNAPNPVNALFEEVTKELLTMITPK